MRMNLAEKHKDTLMMLENLQAKVLDDELIRWKREQQLAGNGVPFHSNLDSIQVFLLKIYPKVNTVLVYCYRYPWSWFQSINNLTAMQ